MAALTPMMQQYQDLKAQYMDCIVFYRLGDFYEMFFEDALVASKALEITLTGRDCGQEERAPMCGIPYHAAETYVNKLISKGFKVAICEQVEDPKLTKGIVKREVVRIVTPGTNLNMQSLDATKNNYLMCVYQNIAHYGVAYVDITTGDFYTTQVNSYAKLLDELAKVGPSELIINDVLKQHPDFCNLVTNRFHAFITSYEQWYFEKKRSEQAIKDQFNISVLDGLGFIHEQEAIIASGALFNYLMETQKSHLGHITHVQFYKAQDYMLLDVSTRRNLELVETLREKDRRGSLIWVLDKTKTAMGARLLRQYVEQPLLIKETIDERLDAVSELKENPILREELKEYLSSIYDLERLMSKISCQTANGRDLIAFKQSISVLEPIGTLLLSFENPLFRNVQQSFDSLPDLFDLLENSIIEEAPITIKEGNLIKVGYNEQVDVYKRAMTEGKQWLAELEAKERDATGIRTLKIKFNKVFGYYLEVTNSNTANVPERYTRKQTLANAERYITPELKEMEETLLGAEEKVMALEYELFTTIRNTLSAEVDRIKKVAKDISLLDVIQSLGEVAEKQGFNRPTVTTTGAIDIQAGRHPVIEKMMGQGGFIHNDTHLDEHMHRFNIITGPNMAGKSTYMRQVALIVLMAQIGSFVPAETAEIGIVDRIFTRVGASDDLASGQSTFMVEMTEVANILRNATKDSLIILDEIGRGTSTFDGLSIAWAVVEYLVNGKTMGSKTLFATHYHELTELEGQIEGIQNYCISVIEKGEDIIFLRKIIPGGADKSYGIQVAKLAGVPELVLQRAREILEQLSEADITKRPETIKAKKDFSQKAVQINLFEDQNQKIIEQLRKADLNQMTPLEAMMLLSQLKKQL